MISVCCLNLQFRYELLQWAIIYMNISTENILMQFFSLSASFVSQKNISSKKFHFNQENYTFWIQNLQIYFFGISNELFFCSVCLHERNISFFVRVYGLLKNKKRKLFLWFFIIYSKQEKWFFRMVTVVGVEMCWLEGFTYWDLSFNLIGFLWRVSYWDILMDDFGTFSYANLRVGDGWTLKNFWFLEIWWFSSCFRLICHIKGF